MSTPSLPSDHAALPPGLSARTLGEEPTLARLLRDAPPGSDDVVDPAFFDVLAGQPLVELSATEEGCPPLLFPVAATRGSLLSAMFSIPLEQAWALLPATERLVPVPVAPSRAAITFFAWDVRRSGVGAYHELGVALPVLLDAEQPPVPAPPAMWRDPSLGLYAAELPIDNEHCARLGEQLAGLPRVVGEAELELNGLDGAARFAFEGRRMAELRVGAPRWPRVRRHDLSFQAYSMRAGRIVRSRYTMLGEGYRGRRGEASIEVGDHRRAQRLGRLELSRRPLDLQVIPRLNWVAWAPEDVGAI
jgi:hypothetical protein